jgi:squalene-hopene/tetraprenyl-beta-curcumene cyclase
MNSNIMNDRPCAGVTSHVVMALAAYGEPSTPATPVGRALNYLASAQEPDGSIESVWFRDNVHGTSRLIETFATVGRVTSPVVTRARKWLLDNQADDGGWPKKFNLPPAHATAEETAWAVYSLLKGGEDPSAAAITSGIEWLVEHQNADATWTPSNVGLYFDDLCYSDDMIADTFTLRTLLLWQSAIQSAGFG